MNPASAVTRQEGSQAHGQAKPSSRIQIEVPCVPVSGNEWQRMHWGRRVRIKRAWVLALHACIHGRPELTPFIAANHELAAGPCRKVRATVSVHKAQRRGGRGMDNDNLRTGLKPAFDALVGAGLLADDSPTYLDVATVQQVVERDPKKHRTVFTLELL